MTELLKVSGKNFSDVIAKAAEVLRKGGTIIYPTETSYGIGADALNKEAVEKVKKIKQQNENKPISVIVADLEMLSEIAETSETTKKLVKKFMPGALTLIVRKRKGFEWLSSDQTFAFRVSSNATARELSKKLGRPITATSANVHGGGAFYSGREAFRAFNGKADAIIDAGELEKKPASTIYSVVSNKVVRLGEIGEKEIEEALK